MEQKDVAKAFKLLEQAKRELADVQAQTALASIACKGSDLHATLCEREDGLVAAVRELERVLFGS